MTARSISYTVVCLLATLSAAAATSAPAMRDADRVRIGEAVRLAASVREEIWDGWGEVPFTLLLVTGDYEYLVNHPYPSEDFESLGHDDIIGAELFARPLSGNFPPNLLATFPAIRGVNTIVMGQPENTGKNSTTWVITALHEHFHQLQYASPGYWDAVAALDLAGDDTSGMWELNFPFPYEDPEVEKAFAAYRDALVRALGGDAPPENFLAARSRLRDSVGDADFRYLSFQLWKEGVARQTEYAVAKAAVTAHQPLPAFTELPDAVSYSQALSDLLAAHAQEMATLDLATWKRVVVYPVGASEAMLLDRFRPGWKSRYFEMPFYLDRYFDPE